MEVFVEVKSDEVVVAFRLTQELADATMALAQVESRWVEKAPEIHPSGEA